MEARLDPGDVERARSFWAEEDVDQVFTGVLVYLDRLKGALKAGTASDKEYVQGLKLLECLDGPAPSPPSPPSPRDPDKDWSVVQVVIGSGEVLPGHPHRGEPPQQGVASPHRAEASPGPPNGKVPSPAGREELLAPLAVVQLQYEPHRCCRTCLPTLPRLHQAVTPFWGHNPLKVPLLCGFKRLSAMPLMSSPPGGGAWDAQGGGAWDGEEAELNWDKWDVVYKAPCGLSLRSYDDVMCYLLCTDSYDVLQVDFFTFNPAVLLDPPPVPGSNQPEQDLSWGAEPTPVELVAAGDGSRPADFRYRKDRWPHGCFLSRGPALFRCCCDCTDGCGDATRCACVAATTGGRSYSHQRLKEPVPAGLMECGPWCGCDRSRCQNRLVQRGIRVRLQVFQTRDRGWGVRCRDDLDQGTFICIYAGVVLQRVYPPPELPPPKLSRADLPSDDEVEVVTEWLAPPLLLEGRGQLADTPPPTMSPPTSPPLHVPVIQRPPELTAPALDRYKVQAVLVGVPDSSSPSGDSPPETVAVATGVNGTDGDGRNLKRRSSVDDVSFIDASRDGNVSRFLNHSCRPNLFLQNVFTDSHDPAFPVVAFFTSRVVKAGGELTWNYAAQASAAAADGQEVPCLCCSDGCRGYLHVHEEELLEADAP
ncbi:histone-lysine N-methyltransferase SETDB2 [Cololabis saira]|uniref:histone-lysine N-methyltransferase SETDB2 n=1 Tax=Cololabis saira TaxID=129043 RepID=UPI002AD529B4|nr:histone-lysine N-methyltransferase SETDB2 [Cololabis saira]